MTTRGFAGAAPGVRSLMAGGSVVGLGDGALLERFEGGGEAARPAFEALVARHGPMVLRVCRGALGDPHDADDAFQATFLVLIRKAGSIRDRDSLASWLHGVALRVSARARAGAARRRQVERTRGEQAGATRADRPGDDLDARLHEELGRLPARYRAPVVLCYLEGHTCEEAARLLRWPVGTVKSRLSRARERLRRRLPRPDLDSLRSIPALPPRLARSAAGSAGASPAAVLLAEGALKVMNLAKWKLSASALAAALTLVAVSAAMTTGHQDPPGSPSAKDPGRPDAARPASDPAAPFTPRSLTARAGSGTALVYALTEKGERIPDRPGGTWKEADSPLRWVAIVGVLDHRASREAEARARKAETPAWGPGYRRVDVERQGRLPGGDWSVWTPMDRQRDYQVLDNLPEVGQERVPEWVRPPAVVDPLPFLKKGTWTGVDAEEVPQIPPGGAGEPPVVMLGGDHFGAKRPDMAPVGATEPPVVMLRSLDFTVEPGRSYRYRVRVVLDDPGATGRRKERPGPWSEPSPEVAVP